MLNTPSEVTTWQQLLGVQYWFYSWFLWVHPIFIPCWALMKGEWCYPRALEPECIYERDLNPCVSGMTHHFVSVYNWRVLMVLRNVAPTSLPFLWVLLELEMNMSIWEEENLSRVVDCWSAFYCINSRLLYFMCLFFYHCLTFIGEYLVPYLIFLRWRTLGSLLMLHTLHLHFFFGVGHTDFGRIYSWMILHCFGWTFTYFLMDIIQIYFY